MPVFLPVKLRHLGCPAALGGPSINITKYLRLQPKYMGKRTIRVIVCDVPIQLNWDVLAAYLIKYDSVEAVTSLKASDGTVHGDYIRTVYLDREVFQAIPHVISYEQQQMMVVVEGRRPLCRPCKQLGHIARNCPQDQTP